MAGLAARCILGRRRSLPTVDAPVLDGNLERNAAFYEAAQAPGIPRSLLKNPYGPETSGMCLDERVGIAIRASLEHSRIVGVICMSMRFSPHSYSDTKRASDRMLTNILAKELRDLVRQTDFVHVSRANEIVIFISLLSSRSDLRKICARLSVAAGANLLALGMPADLQAGMSIYPMDGYSATDLVSSAYARTHRTVPAAG